MTWRDTILENAVTSSTTLADRTRELYLQRVQRFLDFAGTPKTQWTTQMLKSWQRQLRRDGLSPASVRLYVAAVKFAARSCANDGSLRTDFAAAAVTPRKRRAPKAPPTVLRVEQCRALIATTSDRTPVDLRDRALLYIVLRAGLQRDELKRLDLAHVATRYRPRSHWRPSLVPLRIEDGDVFRTVLIDTPTWNGPIRDWIQWLHRHNITTGPVFRSIRPTVADTWRVRPTVLTGDAFAKLVRARGEAAGIPKLTLRILRDTCIVTALQVGIDEATVARRFGLGTLDRYRPKTIEHVGGGFPRLE